MTDADILNHIRDTMARAAFADVNDATLRARILRADAERDRLSRMLVEIGEVLDNAGVGPGDPADRVGELARQRDNLRAERTHVRELLYAAGITSDTIPAAVAMLLQERAEWRARTPAAPDVGTQVMADIAYAREARRQQRTEADDDKHTRREWVDGVTAYLADANEPLALVSESRAALVAAAATLVAALESMDRRAARARDEMAAAAPDVAPGGVEWRGRELFVGGRYEGLTGFVGNGEWMVAFGNRQIDGLPNEATARAVLLALAGQECGRVEFGLRPDALGGALIAACRVDTIGALVGDVWERHQRGMDRRWSEDPALVRAWVAHGQAALTISVPE
jgi:hypothetical protein